MADSTMLAMLKTDLGISTSTAYNTRLEQLLTVAQQAIIEEGASTLDASDPLDMQLLCGVMTGIGPKSRILRCCPLLPGAFSV